jgi:hypothetical protein
MFRLLGLHPGPDISLPAAAGLAGVTPQQAGAALDELTRSQMITERGPRRFAFHDLLRAYANEQSHANDSDTERRTALHRALDHYLHTAHTGAMLINPARQRLTLDAAQAGARPADFADRGTAFAWFEAEHRVLLAAIAFASGGSGFERHAWQLSWTLADVLHQRGHWHDWVATQEIALDAACRLGDLAGQARCHHYLGYARARLGSYPTATPTCGVPSTCSGRPTTGRTRRTST